MKIWIDLTNSPHVNFFSGMINELRQEHEVLLTCRPLANTIGLLEMEGFPLFIVGLPRSGTKLLRGLLNEHSKIGIPDIESEFLPYWISNWSRYGSLSSISNLKKFYRLMQMMPYFRLITEANSSIPLEEWFKACRDYTPAGVFEALIRHDAGVEYGSDKIWGG